MNLAEGDEPLNNTLVCRSSPLAESVLTYITTFVVKDMHLSLCQDSPHALALKFASYTPVHHMHVTYNVHSPPPYLPPHHSAAPVIAVTVRQSVSESSTKQELLVGLVEQNAQVRDMVLLNCI